MNESLLLQHLDLVIEANKTTNITRIDSIENAKLLHIEDSLTGLPYINNAPVGKYADMGSGAGFPGIPIAIMSGRETTLIESVKKKANLLDSFIDNLGLINNVSVYSGRVEELSLEESGQFSVITARALSKLGSLMELASPLLAIGGQLICYKGVPEKDEINHAISLCKKLGYQMLVNDSFQLSDNQTNRSIIVFEKIANPQIRLPRHIGYAQKKPL